MRRDKDYETTKEDPELLSSMPLLALEDHSRYGPTNDATPDLPATSGLVQPMAVTPAPLSRGVQNEEVMVQPTADDTVTDFDASECDLAEAKRRKLWQPTNCEAGAGVFCITL